MACCSQAAARGVRPAMPIAQASEMLQMVATASQTHPSTPRDSTAIGSSVCVEPHTAEIDREALDRLANELQADLCPRISLETLDDRPWARCGQPAGVTARLPPSPESLLCEISGVAHLFGGEAGVLRAAETMLARRGLTARMAIADSVGAAWALAHCGDRQTDDVERIGGQWRPLCGLISSPGRSRKSVASLPVEALRIEQPVADTLHRLGIQKVDQLLSLPKSGLAARLGKPLIRRIDQLLGVIDEPLDLHQPPPEQCFASELEYPTVDLEILAHRMGQLIERVKQSLAASNRGVLQIRCCLTLIERLPVTIEVGLFAPTLDVEHLSELMTHQLESHRLPADVVRLEVSVTLSGPLRSSQASLFDQHAGELDEHSAEPGVDPIDRASLSRLVNALSNRLGRNSVVGVSRSADPLPENAYRSWPLTGQTELADKPNRRSKAKSAGVAGAPALQFEPAVAKENRRPPSPHDALRRPLALLARPTPLVPVGPTVDNERLPSRFRHDGKLYRVLRWWGPERIETGWWKGPSIRRDYYRIETDRGTWWWIFLDLRGPCRDRSSRSRSWMLHGHFN